MKKILVLFFLLYNYAIFSQSTFDERFSTTNNREDVHSISVDGNETILIAGRVAPASGGLSNLILNLIDKNGTLQWSKLYETSLLLGNIKCFITKNKEIMVLAQNMNADNTFGSSVLLIQLDKRGNILQAKKIESSNYTIRYTAGITQDSAGGFAIAYDAQQTSGTPTIISVLHLDSTLNVTWQKTVSVANAAADYFDTRLIVYTSSGNYAIAGKYSKIAPPVFQTWPTLMILNKNGKINSFKQIKTSRFGTANYESMWPSELLEQNNKFRFIGNYDFNGSNYYSFVLNNGTDSAMADILPDNIYSLQSYAQSKKLFGKRLSHDDQHFYLNKKGGFLNVHPSSTQTIKILAQQYDSLGRICPLYSLPYVDTTKTQLKIYVTDAAYTELAEDSINITDITFTATNFANQHIECIGGSAIAANTTTNAATLLQQPTVKLYPNPVQQFATVSFTTVKTGTVSFQVFSANGKLVQSSIAGFAAGVHQKRLNVSTLAAGLYAAVVTIDGKQTSIKFIKSNN